MEKKIKQLKKIITDAIPEILKLKFGCKIITKDGLIVLFEKKGNKWTGEDDTWFTGLHHNTYEKLRIEINEVKEIIGRPIRLNDCVKMIIDSKRWKALPVYDQAKDFFNLNMYWICNNSDDLSKKNKETIDFLLKILN